MKRYSKKKRDQINSHVINSTCISTSAGKALLYRLVVCLRWGKGIKGNIVSVLLTIILCVK